MTRAYKTQNSTNSDLYRKLRKGFAATLALASLYGVTYQSTRSSDNLSRHLTNPAAIPASVSSDYKTANKIPEFCYQYKDNIIQYSREYNIPPEIIVGILFLENEKRTRYEDWKDFLGASIIGRFLRSDPSLGPGQINISTAADLDKRLRNPTISREQIKQALQDPDHNLKYIAKMGSYLIHRENRLPARSLENILGNPHLIAVFGTEYVRGATNKKLSQSRPSDKGLNFASIIAQTNFRDILGQHSTINPEQQRSIKHYIENLSREISDEDINERLKYN